MGGSVVRGRMGALAREYEWELLGWHQEGEDQSDYAVYAVSVDGAPPVLRISNDSDMVESFDLISREELDGFIARLTAARDDLFPEKT